MGDEMNKRCPVCLIEDVTRLGRRSEFHGLESYAPFVADIARFDRDIYRCNSCGMQFTYPPYNDEDFETLYNQEGYREFLRAGSVDFDFKTRYAKRRVARWRDQFVALGITEVKDAVLRERGKPPLFLDVGCGNGRNLLVFTDLGFEVSGIDLSQDNVEFARNQLGFDVNKMSWEDLSSEDSYDCILAAHVLEHVIDPRAFVRKLVSLLPPNGVLILETPRTDDWNMDGHRYRDIYHTLFFDAFTLTLLVAMEGYRLVRQTNISFRNSPIAPFQINMQALFSRDDSLRLATWHETSLNAMRAAYDSIDAEFMRLSRHNLSQQTKLSSILRLTPIGLEYLRKHGMIPTMRQTLLVVKEVVANKFGRRQL